jgi:hypothetical protein
MSARDRTKHDPALARTIKSDPAYRRHLSRHSEISMVLHAKQMDYQRLGDRATVQDALEFLDEVAGLSERLRHTVTAQATRLREIVEEHYGDV